MTETNGRRQYIVKWAQEDVEILYTPLNNNNNNNNNILDSAGIETPFTWEIIYQTGSAPRHKAPRLEWETNHLPEYKVVRAWL